LGNEYKRGYLAGGLDLVEWIMNYTDILEAAEVKQDSLDKAEQAIDNSQLRRVK